MTNEERHIVVLNRMLENMDVYDSIQPTTERKKAIKAAIQALSQEPCQLLIIKSDILLHQDDKKKWMDSIKREKENGVIILPPYFEPLLVPNDIEINIEQEPCDDAISRKKAICVISACDGKSAQIEALEHLPSVTQKSGKWIKHPEIETSTPEYLMFYECSECGDKQCFCKSDIHKKRFCNNCGAKMVEPQESEVSNDTLRHCIKSTVYASILNISD